MFSRFLYFVFSFVSFNSQINFKQKESLKFLIKKENDLNFKILTKNNSIKLQKNYIVSRLEVY